MADRGFELGRHRDERGTGNRTRALSPADRIAERAYFASPADGGLPVLDADPSLVFSSNNYLGLAGDQRVQNAARQAAMAVGTGAGSSRLRTGDTLVHHDLERLLAETLGCERALSFGSRYAANVGTIGALEPDVVFLDEACHESLFDGSRLAGAAVETYAHGDVRALRSALSRRANARDSESESWLLVTDTVFDADGSVAPLAGICDAAETFGAWVLVDETHAIGLYADGGGIVRAESLDDRVQIQTGALATSLASQGGYVAGDGALIEHLCAASRPFAVSTGLAPPAAAAASEALHVARHGDAPERLWDNVAHLRDGLDALGFTVLGESQILPLAVDRRTATALVDGARERGVVASAVTPTPGSASTGCVRLAPIATHDETDIVACLEVLQEVGQSVGAL